MPHSTQVPCTACRASGIPFGPCWPWLRFVTCPGSRGLFLEDVILPLLGSAPAFIHSPLTQVHHSAQLQGSGLLYGALFGTGLHACVRARVCVCACLHLHTLPISLGTPQGQELFFFFPLDTWSMVLTNCPDVLREGTLEPQAGFRGEKNQKAVPCCFFPVPPTSAWHAQGGHLKWAFRDSGWRRGGAEPGQARPPTRQGEPNQEYSGMGFKCGFMR